MAELHKFGDGYHKAVKIICFLVLFAITLSPTSYARAETRRARGSAHIVMEGESLRVLSASNAEVKMEPASTTKILTAVCVIENADIEKTVDIAKEAIGVEGSSIYLKAGEKWKIKDLLFGLMLRSGNDAAVALAVATSGSVKKFVELMNATAFKIGAFSSNFTNPHGLHDDAHYTTAKDLALIAAYAYKYPVFREIVGSKTHAYLRGDKKEVFVNKNKMLSAYEGANGVKTGYTTDSGRCLVSGALREGMQLVCVVLNEPNMWSKSAELLNAAFEKYDKVRFLTAEEPFVVRSHSLKVKKDVCYPLSEIEKKDVKLEYVLAAPRGEKEGREAGYVEGKIGNRLIFCEKVYTI